MPEISAGEIVFFSWLVFGASDISVKAGGDTTGTLLAFAVAKALLLNWSELACNKLVNSPLDTELVSLFDVFVNQSFPALTSATLWESS